MPAECLQRVLPQLGPAGLDEHTVSVHLCCMHLVMAEARLCTCSSCPGTLEQHQRHLWKIQLNTHHQHQLACLACSCEVQSSGTAEGPDSSASPGRTCAAC